MDSASVIAFPRAGHDDDELTVGAAALREIDAAIELVLGGAARRVRLAGLPFVEVVAGTGLARARAAGLGFRLERAEREGVATVTIGPADPSAAR